MVRYDLAETAMQVFIRLKAYYAMEETQVDINFVTRKCIEKFDRERSIGSVKSGGIPWEHPYYCRNDAVRPAATAELSSIQDRFSTEVRMPADDQVCSPPQSNDSAGLSQSPTSTNCVQNESDELSKIDFDIESHILNSLPNISIIEKFFALETDPVLLERLASELSIL